MSPSKIWVLKSHSAFGMSSSNGEQLAGHLRAARDTGRSDKRVVGVVGDGLIEVARGRRLAREASSCGVRGGVDYRAAHAAWAIWEKA